ncbi:MAG: hypothetical protein EOO46_24960 [Flavobacterium sp.]|nr:MAG: hypothetical protein EOO46_24960 [Flavobacterium sp.]
MRFFAFFFFFALCWTGCKTNPKFRPSLQTKIDQLSKDKELGYNDSASVSYLKDSCTKEELLKLLDYKVPIIRILAYRAIVNQNEKDFFDILRNHLSDTAQVTWWYFNDAADDFTISDLMIRKVERKLSRTQKDTLIDLVLKNHNYLETAKWMMEDIEPQEKYYSIIKNKASLKSDNCHDLGLSAAVAKFKKHSDVLFLKDKFSQLTDNPYCNDNIFRAIEIFPDSLFLSVLQRYFDDYIRTQKQSSYDDLELYSRAVAQYQNEKALRILQALTEKSTLGSLKSRQIDRS